MQLGFKCHYVEGLSHRELMYIAQGVFLLCPTAG